MLNNTTLNNKEAINTIELIEQLATQATLQSSKAQINAIESADISAELQSSLLNQDIKMLETQLNLENRIRCQGIHPGEAGEEQQQEEQQQEEQNVKIIAI